MHMVGCPDSGFLSHTVVLAPYPGSFLSVTAVHLRLIESSEICILWARVNSMTWRTWNPDLHSVPDTQINHVLPQKCRSEFCKWADQLFYSFVNIAYKVLPNTSAGQGLTCGHRQPQAHMQKITLRIAVICSTLLRSSAQILQTFSV